MIFFPVSRNQFFRFLLFLEADRLPAIGVCSTYTAPQNRTRAMNTDPADLSSPNSRESGESEVVARWLTQWVDTTEGQRCLSQLPLQRDSLAGCIPKLRSMGLSPSQASAVIELRELRVRAVGKFRHPQLIFMTRRGYEQSSGWRVAAWKSACLRNAVEKNWGDTPCVVLDFCSGVGGDLLELARYFPTLGIDRDPALVHFANTNINASSGLMPAIVVEADLQCMLDRWESPATTGSSSDGGFCEVGAAAESESLLPSVPRLRDWLAVLPVPAQQWAIEHDLLDHRVLWHLDPDRRDEHGRHTRIETLSPSPDVWASLLTKSPVGVLKLAPATTMGDDWERRGHWQWLGHDRECKQLLGVFGLQASWPSGTKSVAVVGDGLGGSSLEFSEDAEPLGHYWQSPESLGCQAVSEPQAYLYEPHPAFYASRTAGEFASERGWARLVGGDYFTASQQTLEYASMYASFEVWSCLPLRLKTVLETLESWGGRIGEIKSRAIPESERVQFQKTLRQRFRGGPCQVEPKAMPDPGWQSWVQSGAPWSLLLYREEGRGLGIRLAICRRLP